MGKGRGVKGKQGEVTNGASRHRQEFRPSATRSPSSKHFSMQDAANRTQLSGSSQAFDVNLRTKPVAFVKANQAPPSVEDPPPKDIKQSPDDASKQHHGDLSPQPSNETVKPTETLQISRPSSASSSEDVVLFAGRKTPLRTPTPLQSTKPSWDDTPGTWLHQADRRKLHLERKIRASPDTRDQFVRAEGFRHRTYNTEDANTTIPLGQGVDEELDHMSGKHEGRHGATTIPAKSEEQSTAVGTAPSSDEHHAPAHDEPEDTTGVGGTAAATGHPTDALEVSPGPGITEVRDLDVGAKSQSRESELDAEKSSCIPSAQHHALLVAADDAMDLRSRAALNLDQRRNENPSEDEANWEDEEDEDEEEDEDDPELSDDLEISDSQLARMLAKQEELGIGSDELILMDDMTLTDEPSFPPSSRRTRKKQAKRIGSTQPQLGDDDELFGGHREDDFDIMDWERPSIRSKRGPPTQLNLSDSELEQTLQESWHRDRHKKKVIKQQREELRLQGLLGSRTTGGVPKLHPGFSMDELRDCLEDFLDGDRQSFDLPPTAKAERKAIHEIASAFNCKSKSSGSGSKRYPVIYKTRKTIEFDDRVFNRLQRRFGRLFFKDSGSFPSKSASQRGPRGRNGGGAIHYREGETVGAGASEIGVENRGRAMLEKMGWSKGTALGAANNKGILMPIEHVVKTSRAGLG